MDFRDLYNKGDLFDTSEILQDIVEYRRWNVLAYPAGNGKTTLLSMIYYYLEQSEDSRAIFENLHLAHKWGDWDRHLNRYVVLTLDFSDFHEESMKDALAYIRRKMQDLYQRKAAYLFEQNRLFAHSAELFLAFITDDPDLYQLEWSLKELMSICCFARDVSSGMEDRVVLLMDNVVMLEKKAKEYGYEREMRGFLEKFLDFEPIEKCFIYLQVGDEKQEERTRSWRSEYLSYYPPCVYPNSHDIFKYISLIEGKIEETTTERMEISQESVPENLNELLCEAQARVESEKIERKLAAERRKKEKARRYALPLPDGIIKYSKNMGLRELKLPHKTKQYDTFNAFVKKCYKKYNSCKDYIHLYRELQNLDESRPTDWDIKARNEILAFGNGLREGWEIKKHNSDRYWDYFSITNGERMNYGIRYIKVYVTITDDEVKDIYIGAIKELVLFGQNGFVSKISKYHRDENICFWVEKSEYKILRAYFDQCRNKLRQGLPFIAHDGLLGISHDLIDLDSHNALQAKLLWDYFQETVDVSMVDVEDMYDMFIHGWNADAPEDSLFRKDFENISAQAFVIIMDTFDILIGNEKFTEFSLLLSDDENIWRSLGEAKCWADIA